MKTALSMTLTVALCVGTASAALAGYANAFSIAPLSGDRFQVRANISPGTSTFWCGAASYAGQQLSLPGTQRLYVTDARSTHSEGSVVSFGLTPPTSGAVQSVSNSVDLVGNNLSVTQARQHCYDKTIKD